MANAAKDIPDVESASEFSDDGNATDTTEVATEGLSDASIPTEKRDIIFKDITLELKTSSAYPICEKYDLILLLTSGSLLAEFQVSKEILSRSSSEIERMITAKPTSWCIREGKKVQYINICGSKEALMRILYILHFQAGDDLYGLEFDEVIEIAALCELYSWSRSIHPWPRIWWESYERYAMRPGYEDWLYLTQVFGGLYTAENLINDLILDCKPSPKLSLSILRDGEEVSTRRWCLTDRKKVLDGRLAQIEQMLKLLRCVYERFRSPNFGYEKFCDDPICGYIARGSLLNCLEDRGLARFIETVEVKNEKGQKKETETQELRYQLSAKDWEGSVNDLLEVFKNVELDTLGERLPKHDCDMEDILDSILSYEPCLE
ncbi:hypothetical protein TWF694_008021 [Orbilia ellipsospora]|uniref:BTB domain-containing protein n=1 Tax=Orbilia ellipsospora TaxID=2528407 RepID=A0AAV9XG93_9PEZI